MNNANATTQIPQRDDGPVLRDIGDDLPDPVQAEPLGLPRQRNHPGRLADRTPNEVAEKIDALVDALPTVE